MLDEGFAFSLATSYTEAHEGDVNFVQWHPTQPDTLLSSGDDNTIKVWILKE
jgi:WD40 repeat protein